MPYKKLETTIREQLGQRPVRGNRDANNKTAKEYHNSKTKPAKKPTVGQDGKEKITIKPSLEELKEYNEIDDAATEAMFIEGALAKYNPHQLQKFLSKIQSSAETSKIVQMQVQAVQAELQNRSK